MIRYRYHVIVIIDIAGPMGPQLMIVYELLVFGEAKLPGNALFVGAG